MSPFPYPLSLDFPMMSKNSPIPCLVIGAPQGRSGKTTVTLGLCAAFAGRGLVVQPFKKGPDYIDPSWLSAAAGRDCRSLDPFFTQTDAGLRAAFGRGAQAADLALVEGNHGLYDSSLPTIPGKFSPGEASNHDLGEGSTAAVARTLGAPVLLVVNAARMGRSAAAMVHGYQSFEPETEIAGVILNNVAQSRHEAKLRQAIEAGCGIPVVGALPPQARLTIPDRHLGLVPRGESEIPHPAIAACRQAAEQYLDLEKILEIAGVAERRAEAGQGKAQAGDRQAAPERVDDLRKEPPNRKLHGPRIGILRDRAFSFYYPENLEALQAAGAELVFIDSLQDKQLPVVDLLYIGGGFPEIFMNALEANHSLRASIREALAEGLPAYAECGGLMYLARGIHWQGRRAEMVGALPVEVEMDRRPQGHGYVLAETGGESAFFPQGVELRGHEFHHSRLVSEPRSRQALTGNGLPTEYRLLYGKGLGEGRDGLVRGNVLAAYTHLHADGAPGWATAMVRMAGG